MSLADIIQRDPSDETLQQWLKKVPYATYLGIQARLQGPDILFILPADEKLIGNRSLPAIHGGVVGAFMEQAGAFHLIAKMEKPVLPKIIDFSLDYLRATRLQETYAQCSLTREGRSIANISITAWQEDKSSPTATARAHYLIDDAD